MRDASPPQRLSSKLRPTAFQFEPGDGTPRLPDPRSIWVPARAYQISIISPWALNLFEQTVLEAVAAGIRTPEAIKDMLGIEPLVSRQILQKALKSGWITQEGSLLPEGTAMLTGRTEQEARALPVWVYRMDLTGELIPALLTDHQHMRHLSEPRHQGCVLGSRGVPSSPPTTPELRELARRVRLMGSSGAQLCGAYGDPAPEMSVLLGGRAQPLLIETFVYLPRGASSAKDWAVAMPLCRAQDLRLRQAAVDSSDSAIRQIIKHFSSKFQTSPKSMNPLARPFFDAESELARDLGSRIGDHPELHRTLLSALAQLSFARQIESNIPAGINSAWAMQALLEPAVVNAARALEELLAVLLLRFPCTQRVQGKRIENDCTDAERQKIEQDNRSSAIRLTESLGFRTEPDKLAFFVEYVSKLAGRVPRPPKRIELANLLVLNLLAAAEHEQHPLRAFAATCPDGLKRFHILRRHRNSAAHAASVQRRPHFDDVEAAVNDVRALVRISLTEYRSHGVTTTPTKPIAA